MIYGNYLQLLCGLKAFHQSGTTLYFQFYTICNCLVIPADYEATKSVTVLVTQLYEFRCNFPIAVHEAEIDRFLFFFQAVLLSQGYGVGLK